MVSGLIPVPPTPKGDIMEKILIRHNGRFEYQYSIEGKRYYLLRELIDRLAREAGYEIVNTGDGSEDLKGD
jgi:hypothetical protein